MHELDAAVIGGGLYGCAIAVHLARSGAFPRIALVEREPALMARASFNNQSRVHAGYHYPRSFATAHRSRVNSPRFMHDWPASVHREGRQLYAIARQGSRVGPRQYERFCRTIGAPLRPAADADRALFDRRRIAAVYAVDEASFDVDALRAWAPEALREARVTVRLGETVRAVAAEGGAMRVELVDGGGAATRLSARLLINCGYSGLGQIDGLALPAGYELKHEIAELCLVALPEAMARLSITVMDGPFFSVVPYGGSGRHTLSHVRFTPHQHWQDRPGLDPYQRLAAHREPSRFDRMLRDARRFVPSLDAARHQGSLLEVKTLLARNEVDDGRPILFHRHQRLGRCFSVLGGKLDNLYDALATLDATLGLAAALA